MCFGWLRSVLPTPVIGRGCAVQAREKTKCHNAAYRRSLYHLRICIYRGTEWDFGRPQEIATRPMARNVALDYADVRLKRQATYHGQATEATGDARMELTRHRSVDRITLALRNGQTHRGSRSRSDQIVLPDTDAATMLLIPTRLVRHKAASRHQTASARLGAPHTLGSMRNTAEPVSGWSHATDLHPAVCTLNTTLDRNRLTTTDATLSAVNVMPTFRGERGYYGKKHYGKLVELLDLSLPMPRLKNQLTRRTQPQYIDIVRPMSSADLCRDGRTFRTRASASARLATLSSGQMGRDVSSCPVSPTDCGARKRSQRPQTAQYIDTQYSSRFPRHRVLSKTPHCSPEGSLEDLTVVSPLRQSNASTDVLLRDNRRHLGNLRYGDVTSGKNRGWSRDAAWPVGRSGGAVNTCPSNKDGTVTHDGASVNRPKYTLTVYVPCATDEGGSHRA